ALPAWSSFRPRWRSLAPAGLSAAWSLTMISKSSTACCLCPSPLIIAPSLGVKQRAFLLRSNRVCRSPDGWHSQERPREDRSFCCIALRLLLALSGHPDTLNECPLSGD